MLVNPVTCAEPENTPDPFSIVACVIEPPNAVLTPAIVIAELANFALVIVEFAISPSAIVPSAIIAEVTLPAPIVATPAAVIVTSPLPVTVLANIELEKYGSNDPESTVNVLAALPSYVPPPDKPHPAVKALGLEAITPVNPAPEPLNDPVNDPVKVVVACVVPIN